MKLKTLLLSGVFSVVASTAVAQTAPPLISNGSGGFQNLPSATTLVVPNISVTTTLSAPGLVTAGDLASGAALTNLGYTPAHSGANSDITSLSGITTPISTMQGGIGATSIWSGINASPAAATLTGPETFWCDQGSATVKCSATQMAAYVAFSTLPVYQIGPGINGFACNYGAGNTDDTAAWNALFATIQNATVPGGTVIYNGRCLFLGALVQPNNGNSNPSQAPIRIIGTSAAGSLNSGFTTPGTSSAVMVLRSTSSLGKLQTYGLGILEIANLTIMDDQTDCGSPFLYTTNTQPIWHDNTFVDSSGLTGLTACKNAMVLGGTSTTIGGGTNAAFQGYPPNIYDNNFYNIQSGWVCQSFCNGGHFHGNNFALGSGSSHTASITAATNANPAVLTVTHGLTTADGPNLIFKGFTGSWTALNGNHPVTVIDSTHLSVPINSTSFGALTGTPGYYDGCAIDMSGGGGSGGGAEGNTVNDNLVEMTYYPCLVHEGPISADNSYFGNEIFDTSSTTTAYYYKIDNSTPGTTSSFLRGQLAGLGPGFGNGIPEFVGAGAGVAWDTFDATHGNFGNARLLTNYGLDIGFNTSVTSPHVTITLLQTPSSNPWVINDYLHVPQAYIDTNFALHIASIQFTGAGQIFTPSSQPMTFYPGGSDKLSYNLDVANAWNFNAAIWGTTANLSGAMTAASYTAGSTAGVSCAANTVSLTTLVVTNGIVTHC